jgi:hypothetical protein
MPRLSISDELVRLVAALKPFLPETAAEVDALYLPS